MIYIATVADWSLIEQEKKCRGEFGGGVNNTGFIFIGMSDTRSVLLV